MVSALNAREHEIYMGLEAGLLARIFWAGKGGEPSEVEGKHVTLPTHMQGPVPIQW